MLATPHGILVWREGRAGKRRRRLVAAHDPAGGGRHLTRSYSPEDAVAFLVGRGLDENELLEGSIPKASLDFLGEVVADRLPAQRPLIALHIGNFVGVSLGYFTSLLRQKHPESVVVSIDPNVLHRGIKNPQAHVLALLEHFDLLANSVVIPGYTLEPGLGQIASPDVEQQLMQPACEQVVPNLRRIGGPRYDLVVLDGNHDSEYLAREVEHIRDLLAPGGIVVFDDVTLDAWYGVEAIFGRALRDASFGELGKDGRVGVLQMARDE